MSRTEKIAKREKAMHKLGNQLSVLSHTGTKAQIKAVKKMQDIFQGM